MASLDVACRNGMLQGLANTIAAASGNARIVIFNNDRTLQLATLTMSATPFAVPNNGSMSANVITADPSADNTGTAALADVQDGAGTTRISGLLVGTSGAQVNFSDVAFVQGKEIRLTSFVVTMLAA